MIDSHAPDISRFVCTANVVFSRGLATVLFLSGVDVDDCEGATDAEVREAIQSFEDRQ